MTVEIDKTPKPIYIRNMDHKTRARFMQLKGEIGATSHLEVIQFLLKEHYNR